MKYDDASWHYGGDFPKDLPNEAGSTHIGIFLAWCHINDFAGELHLEEFPEDLEKIKKRDVTPGRYLEIACDEKFTDEDLNEEGNSFCQFYFSVGDGYGDYLEDYEVLSGELPSLYHVPDTWESFDKLSPLIDKRYKDWKG